MNTYFNASAWLLGLMLAPHTLALLGNLSGQLQTLLLALITIAVPAYWLNIRSFRYLTGLSTVSDTPLDALATELGETPAAALFFSGKWLTAIAASTVLLVTAGFVFNETFVYWFPNFAFAFILLGLIMFIHLLGNATVQRFQTALIGLTLAGLVVLIGMGLAGQPSLDTGIANEANRSFLRPCFAVLMLFVGFDLATHPKHEKEGLKTRHLFAGLFIAGVIFSLWGWVSLQHVPADKLADTYIAHILAAKSIGGQTGRLIMGMVIIAGTGAAVNALLWNQARGVTRLTAVQNISSPALAWVRHPVSGTLLSGSLIAIMMATGMAGTDAIDTYVRAGLYLWILYYASLHLGVLLHQIRGRGPLTPLDFWPALTGLGVMSMATIGLVTSDPERWLVLKVFLGILLMISVLIALAGMVNRVMMKGKSS